MRAMLLDVYTQEVKIVDVESNIYAWYELLNCDMVEMPERKIENKYFTFICDEEGLLKSEPIISVMGADGSAMITGSILICNWEEGDITDLTEEDIKLISKHVRQLIDFSSGQILNVIADVEY
jgi:hypothetical protein